ncbi:WXG100 family type VII secretion target [Amycolatopsis roodepoortensis]|uniref:WXG100 family type VII secretion target n=1 Tax=Amycolatopsis roodepoortensis TaxID=700274 RepID=UPI00214CE70A|nr:WXG100 family type VII secretion target [Amycolatopsis roodepoortensis]UUV32416.1 WXG100 family type VII secretion target [Amycolatopsis roodepoortensis]
MPFLDPEPLYAKLTSGDAAGIAEVDATIADTKASLQTVADGISDGALWAARSWRGTAAAEFIGKAKASSRAVAEVYGELQTAEAAVKGAAKAYSALRTSADAAIKPWRELGLSDLLEAPEIAMKTIRALTVAQQTYESRLTALAATTDGGGEGWDSEGNADISGVDPGEPWTSQGLAYDGENLLVGSYHDGDGDGSGDSPIGPGLTPSRLTYVDYETGVETGNVYLNGNGDVGAPTHTGGVATDGEHVWVSSNGYVYVYDKAELDAAQDSGRPVDAVDVVPTPAHSYVTYAQGKLFVGDYGNNRLYEVPLGPDGSPQPDKAGGPIETPNNVQGVVVRDDEFIFSSSDGHSGKFYRQDRTPEWYDFNDREEIELRGGEPGNEDGYDSHGVEEAVEIDGEIVLAHESGAYGYQKNPGSKWDEPELTRISLEELGLDPDGALSSGDAGYETDPDSLVGAAGVLDGATSTLSTAAGAMSRLQLVSHLLGEVPAAATFSDTLTKRVNAAGDRLTAGVDTVGGIADSLVTGADTYRRIEDGIREGLEKLGNVLP